MFCLRAAQIIEMRMLTSALAVRVLGTEVNVQGVFTHLDEFVDSHCEITALRSLWTHYLQVWVSQHSWTRDDDDSVTSKDDGLFGEPACCNQSSHRVTSW